MTSQGCVTSEGFLELHQSELIHEKLGFIKYLSAPPLPVELFVNGNYRITPKKYSVFLHFTYYNVFFGNINMNYHQYYGVYRKNRGTSMLAMISFLFFSSNSPAEILIAFIFI